MEDIILNHKFAERNSNENEKRVVKKLLEICKDFPDSCYCSHCLDDIYCIALIHLPPKYQNATIQRLDKSNKTPDEDIIDAVIKAIKFVRNNPSKNVEHQPGAVK